MDNSPFLHTDKHTDPNEDSIKKNRDLGGISNSEYFLHYITKSTPSLIYLMNLQNGNIIYINEMAAELFGYDAKSVYENDVNFLGELVHPDDREERNTILQIATDNTVIEAEVRFKMKDGQYHWFKMEDRIIKKTVDPTVWQTIGLGIDITAQKNAFSNLGLLKPLSSEKNGITLSEQSKLLQGVANAIPDILFVLDLSTKSFIYTNKKIAKILGYDDEQILGMGHPILDIIYDEDRPAMIKHLDDMQTAEDGEIREIEYRMKNKDGSLRWFIDRNTVFKRNSAGKPIEKIGIAQDITLRKSQEDKINKSLKILQQSEELAQIGNWDYDIKSKKMSWSEGMYILFDMEKDSPVKPSVYLNYVLEQDRPVAEKIIEAIQQTHNPFTEILRIQLGNKVKTLKIQSTVYKDDMGKQISVIGVDMDITASILTEMQIKELNHNLEIKNRGLESANADLKAFNTLAATNYRQTLQKLYTSMEYLITNDARNLTNEGRANIRRTQSSIQKMKLMTEDIINLSKLHTLDTKLALVNLNDAIAEVITSMNDKITEVKALVHYTQMPTIQGYSILISLLFHHLLDNAIKFRRLGVIPKIDFKRNAVILNSVAYNTITITDNGIGIDEENTQEVFTMFNRHDNVSYKGSGIGLAVCKKIMDIHDGFITASSIPNKETTFTCFFPVIKPSK